MHYSPAAHFLQVSDWSAQRLDESLGRALALKRELAETGRNQPVLAGKTLAMLFEKPSLRTRVSFAVAMTQLGGSGLLLRQDEVGLDTREPTEDVARVLTGMVDGIMIRTFAQERVEKLAHYCETATGITPVINGLTDLCHPCQAMADVMTLHEHVLAERHKSRNAALSPASTALPSDTLRGKTLTFIGDGNNVARSLAVICGKLGMRFVLATPPAYGLPEEDIDRIMAQVPGLDFVPTNDPVEAVREADCVYTDTWVSMGQEAEKEKRVRDFAGFRVDETLMAAAPARCVVLHCLPAYRGYEISEAVLEDRRSLVFPQAHNRLHAQKGILATLIR